MIKEFKIFCLFIALLVTQSCSLFTDKNSNLNYNCDEIFYQLNDRYKLFAQLDKKEIRTRQQLEVPTVSRLDELSVFSKIIEAVKNAPANAQLIAVDLRHYKNVDLGNIVISNVNQSYLSTFLKTSKYSQGFFALINFNNKTIKYYPVEINKVFNAGEIKRRDLDNTEIVINVSDSKRISGNMKFSANQQVSIIADNIIDPYRLDLRESSNMQFNLDKKWVMSVYSFENSYLKDGKVTTGFFKFINNKNSQVKLQKFDKSTGKCYIDSNTNKLK
ncbi:MAG: hypothetical protein ACKO47_01575 [Alphaproteobacteria bacterium]